MDYYNEVRIDAHTLKRAFERGTDEEEIREVVAAGFSIPARQGRLGKARVYPFYHERCGKFYEQKRVEVFYVVEESAIITVTVYVFYGKWEA